MPRPFKIDILHHRLNKRVDSMLEQGLLDEVRNFYEEHIKCASNETYTKGVLQSIGVKEFAPYLEKYDKTHDAIISKYLENSSYILSAQKEEDEPEGLELLRNCLEDLKLITRRYSRKQIKWIKNRLLGSTDRLVPPLYALDTSNIDLWNSNVRSPAIDIIQSYISNKSPILAPLESLEHPGAGLNEEVSNYCTICKRHFVGEFQWNLHLSSNKHKRTKEGQRRRAKEVNNHSNTK